MTKRGCRWRRRPATTLFKEALPSKCPPRFVAPQRCRRAADGHACTAVSLKRASRRRSGLARKRGVSLASANLDQIKDRKLRHDRWKVTLVIHCLSPALLLPDGQQEHLNALCGELRRSLMARGEMSVLVLEDRCMPAGQSRLVLVHTPSAGATTDCIGCIQAA